MKSAAVCLKPKQERKGWYTLYHTGGFQWFRNKYAILFFLIPRWAIVLSTLPLQSTACFNDLLHFTKCFHAHKQHAIVHGPTLQTACHVPGILSVFWVYFRIIYNFQYHHWLYSCLFSYFLVIVKYLFVSLSFIICYMVYYSLDNAQVRVHLFIVPEDMFYVLLFSTPCLMSHVLRLSIGAFGFFLYFSLVLASWLFSPAPCI